MKRLGLILLLVAAALPPTVWSKDPETLTAAVTVLEVSTTESKKIETVYTGVTDPEVSLTLTVTEGNGKATAICLKATPFVHASGESVVPSILVDGKSDATKYKLNGHGSMTVTLKASLLRDGNWRTVIRLHDAKSSTLLSKVYISVNRVLSEVPVSLAPAAASAVTLGLPYFTKNEPVAFRLHATGSDREFILPAPTLLNATLRQKAADSDGIADIASTLKLSPSSAASVPSGEVTPIDLELDGISGPGRHEATLRFAPVGYKPLDTKLTIFVRDSAFTAVGFIFMGVLLSFFVLGWTQVLRPRLQREARALELLQRLESLRLLYSKGEEAVNEEALSLVLKVARNFQSQWDRKRSQRTAPTDTELDGWASVVDTLPAWAEAQRHVRGARPMDVAEEFKTELANVRKALEAETPDIDKVRADAKELIELPAKIRTKVIEELKKDIKKLSDSLANSQNAAFVTVSDQLAAALARLNPPAQLEAAVGIYDTALSQFILALKEDLYERIGPKKRPSFIDPQGWDALQEAVRSQLNAVSAKRSVSDNLASLRGGTRVYVQRFSAALLGKAATLLQADADEVRKALEEADSALNDNLLVDAQEALSKAQGAYEAGLRNAGLAQMGSGLAEMSAALTMDSAASGLDFSALQLFGVAMPWTNLQRTTPEQLSRGIGRGDLLISAVLFLVAVLTGLQVLWVPDLTWGGWTSWLAAFLWGFAVDQFGHAGVKALRPS